MLVLARTPALNAPVTGTIRLIDPALGSQSLRGHCTALETEVMWGRQGPKGDPGLPGEKGANGAALAFAHIDADGTLDASRSKNVAAVTVLPPGILAGYCIQLDSSVSGQARNIVTQPGAPLGGGSDVLTADIASASPYFAMTGCPASTDAFVKVFGNQAGFYVLVN